MTFMGGLCSLPAASTLVKRKLLSLSQASLLGPLLLKDNWGVRGACVSYPFLTEKPLHCCPAAKAVPCSFTETPLPGAACRGSGDAGLHP